MFLGIDIGTSGVKTTITDITGTVLAYEKRPVQTYGAERGYREICPQEVKNTVFESMQKVLRLCGGKKVDLITISSLGEAVVPVAKDGTVLRNSIIGADARGSEELKQIMDAVGEETLTDITGLNLSNIYSLNKILYLKNHYPRIHQAVWKYMCFTDYMGYLLTGETKIDYAMASRTMAFDARVNEWSERILEKAQISADVFSSPVPGGTLIGTVKKSVRELVGLKAETPVMAGSHDHIYNALGAGAVYPGSCSNIVGTTEGITAILSQRLDSGIIREKNLSCQPFVLPNHYNTVAWHNTACAMVNWYVETFFSESGLKKREILDKLNNRAADGPSALMVLPHFSGSTAGVMDEKAKGCIIGLTVTTAKEDVYRAILEGACYECRVIIEAISAAGIPAEKIIVSGGGSRSKLWLQTKADILGRPIFKSGCAETGALGGAVLGAVVLGVFPDLESAVRNMVKPGEMIEPRGKYHKIYEERYEAYKELYMKMKPVNHML